jgi:hypothetical protein
LLRLLRMVLQLVVLLVMLVMLLVHNRNTWIVLILHRSGSA